MILRDPTHVLRGQVAVLDKSEEFFSRSLQKYNSSNKTESHSTPMQTSYFYGIYNSIHQRVFCCQDEEFIWNEGNLVISRSFVVYLQVFSDNNCTT